MDKMKWMKEAVALGRNGMNRNDGGPFGCVVVKNGKVVGRGWNRVLAKNDPTAHAEIVAIRDACNNLGSYQLEGCEIYTSCEPCPMCMASIYWARPAKVYFGAQCGDAAAAGFDDAFIYRELQLPVNERSVLTEEMGREEAMPLFEEWLAKEGTELH